MESRAVVPAPALSYAPESAPPSVDGRAGGANRGLRVKRVLVVGAIVLGVGAAAAIVFTTTGDDSTSERSPSSAAAGTSDARTTPTEDPRVAQGSSPQAVAQAPLDGMRQKLARAELSPSPLAPSTLPALLVGSAGSTETERSNFTMTFTWIQSGVRNAVTFGRADPGRLKEDLQRAEARGSTPESEDVAGRAAYYICGHLCGYAWSQDGHTYEAFGRTGQSTGEERATLRSLVASATVVKPAPVGASVRPIDGPRMVMYHQAQGLWSSKIPRGSGWSKPREKRINNQLFRTVIDGPEHAQIWIDTTASVPPTFGFPGATATTVSKRQVQGGQAVSYRFQSGTAPCAHGACVDTQLTLGRGGIAVLGGPTAEARKLADQVMDRLQPDGFD